MSFVPWILIMMITPICFQLHLCSAIILYSYDASNEVRTQDFNSPLVVEFKAAFPYFLHKIYDDVLDIFSGFVKDPSL
ncbi:uncharacterized protein EV420DRAFT_1543328, partial [Desarmillaria tabescens]